MLPFNQIIPHNPANRSRTAKRIDEDWQGGYLWLKWPPACHEILQSPPFPFWLMPGDKRVRRDRGASFAPRISSMNPRILHIQPMEIPCSLLCYLTCKSAPRMKPCVSLPLMGDSLAQLTVHAAARAYGCLPRLCFTYCLDPAT